MSRRYAIFDQSALGADLDIQRGGVLLTTVDEALNISRTCRCTVGALEYESFAELILETDGTALTNRVSVGIVTTDASLSTYVGGDDQGVGWRMGEGQIHHDGGSIASVSAGADGDAIGVLYAPLHDDDGNADVVFYRKPKGGAPELLASVPLPAEMIGKPLFLAGSLGSGTDPGSLKLHLNSGQSDYENPVVGQDAGWWEAPVLPGALRISDAHVISGRDDSPPHTRWEGVIAPTDIVEDRALSFWIWDGRGGSAARGSAVTLDATDPSGLLTPFLGGSYRDQPAVMIDLPAGELLSAGTALGSYVVERIEVVDALRRRITLRDALATFEVPLQRRRIRPDSDPEAAGNWWPCLIGPGFSLPVVLLDQASRIYGIDGTGVEGVARVRERGNPLDPSAEPPDYQVHGGGQTMNLSFEPRGIVTVDAVATGGDFAEPSEPVDIIDGDGDPFDGGAWTATAAAGSPGSPPTFGSGSVTFPHPGHGASCYITHDTAQFEAGKTYRITFVLQFATAVDEFAPGSIIALCRSGSEYDRVRFEDINYYNATYPRTVEWTYTAATTHGVHLHFRAYVTMPHTCIVGGLTIIELPPVVEDGEDGDETDQAVAEQALPLARMAQIGIEQRARKPANVWSMASAEAIDAASGYTGQGFWAREGCTLREYLEALCPGYTASVFLNNAGELAFAWLIDPETVDATGAITLADLLPKSEPTPTWDDMPGLTRRIGVRPNDHVFRDDDLAEDLEAVDWRKRRRLTRPHRITCTYGGPLADGLGHADVAEPLATRLMLREDGQAEADRIGAIAAIPRAFVSCRIRDPRRFDLGRVVTLEAPQWWATPRRLLVVGMRDQRLARRGHITLWGRAPWAPEV